MLLTAQSTLYFILSVGSVGNDYKGDDYVEKFRRMFPVSRFTGSANT